MSVLQSELKYFFRRFIKGFSVQVQPLYTLIKKDTSFKFESTDMNELYQFMTLRMKRNYTETRMLAELMPYYYKSKKKEDITQYFIIQKPLLKLSPNTKVSN